MNNSKIIAGSIFAVFIFASAMSISIPYVEAHPHSGTIQTESHSHQPISEIIPLDGEIGIEKTTIQFHASEENTLPWGFVEGKIANHVGNYPVIIQIYDEHGEAYHFAQTEVEEDGSYEYKFRVRNVNDGQVTNIFEGDYFVKIFKVVYLESNSGQA
jgi:hypothetical protein